MIPTARLYALHITTSHDGAWKVVAASNEIDKLTAIAASNTFLVLQDPNDPTLLRSTPEGDYPRYLIREMPYVC